MAVSFIPKGHHTVTTTLVCNNASAVIDFMKGAFDAEVLGRMDGPGGKVMHAEIKIGDSLVMIGDGMPPQHPPVDSYLYLYLPDVDATYKKAVAAGGKTLEAPKDQFWGDRVATVADPSGNRWSIATHKEELTGEEIKQRMNEMMAKMGAKA